jgi:hypothetical protein
MHNSYCTCGMECHVQHVDVHTIILMNGINQYYGNEYIFALMKTETRKWLKCAHCYILHEEDRQHAKESEAQ